MSKHAKLLDQILRGRSDSSVHFKQLCAILKSLGFSERIKGSHHIFTREGVDEILNLQPRGSQAKPYQVKQVRNVIIEYGLAGTEEPNDEDQGDSSTV